MGPPEQENTSGAGAEQDSTGSRQEPPPTPPRETKDHQLSSNASSGPPGATTGNEMRPITPPSQISAKSSKSGHTLPMTPDDEDNEAKKNVINQGKPAGNHSDLPKQDERREPPTTGRTTQAINHPESNPENNAAEPTQRTAPRKENSLTSRLSTALSSIVNRGLRSVYTPSKKRTIRIPRRYLD